MAYRAIPPETQARVRALLRQGLTDTEVAGRTGVSRTTVARIRKQVEDVAAMRERGEEVTCGFEGQPPVELTRGFATAPASESTSPAAEPIPAPAPHPAAPPPPEPPSVSTSAGNVVTNQPADAPPAGTSPPSRRTVWDDALYARLRRALDLPPAPPPERRPVPRRTFAWYVPVELGEAIQAQAEAAGIAPSQVVEWILYRAREQGWILPPDRLEPVRRFRDTMDALAAAVQQDDRETARKLFERLLESIGYREEDAPDAPDA